MPLYNRAHYGYTTESNQMYYSLPAVMSSNHYAIIFDNSAKGQLDIGHTESNVLQFSAVGGRTAYIVVMSDNQSELVKTLVSATGRQPLPPRWALGNFASRFGYRNEQQTREVVATFQQEGIPLDAIVLDLYWFGKDVKGHMGALTWDREAFPNPEEMLADFKDQNVKSVLITEPFILSTSSQFTPAVDHSALAKNHNGKPKLFDFYFGNTGLVDVFNEKSKQWFWSYYATLLKQGVAGWWGDLGEPEVHPDDSLHNWNGITVTGDEIHNIYGHKWAEMVYQNTLKAKSNYRPFVLMRSGFIGSQRYGMIPWTGDVSRSWGGLKPQVELALQMSIFGLAYTHSDLGGFAGGEAFDPDLYLRWLNMGVFSPVFRPHGQENIPSEPIFHPESVKYVAKQLIELRYAMLPYNYSLVYENSLTGIPLMRPVSFVDSDPKWFDNHDSYLWGDTLLVSPITEPNTVIKQVDLPSGVWFDFYSDEKYQGQTLAKVTVNQSTIPVFAKAGGILPMVEGLYNTSDYKGDELIVHVWLDGSVESNSFTMYEDNGNDPNAIGNQEFATIEFTLTHHDGQFTIQTISSGRYPKMPQHRNLHWIFHGLETLPKSVKRDNQIGGVSVLEQYWSDNNRTLHVKDAWKHGEFVVISIDR
jgi:oligosaccharide 4-alpha-D-glucosyltransferase